MTRSEPEGLGGWLVLIGLGLIVAPIRMLHTIATDLVPIATEGYWAILTNPTSEAYHPLWAPLLIFEAVGNAGFIAAGAYLLFHFFQRSPRFPRLMRWFLLANLAFVAIDYFAAEAIPAVAGEADPSSTRELGRTVIGCLIWIPYLRKSRRVRNTFRPPLGEPTTVSEPSTV